MKGLRRLPYTLLLVLAAPLIAVYLLWRARRQPEYRHHWGERFLGAAEAVPGAAAASASPCIWVHAVSVGETRAAEPLLAALAATWPGHRLLVSHMTPTGRATPLALPGVERVYLPYDYPWAMRRFLRTRRPVLGILMETEVWPNLVAAARAAGVPLVLANARLSARSLDRAGHWGGLVRDAVAGLAAVLAQTEADAARLTQLGARPEVTGNLKFDAGEKPGLTGRGRAWHGLWGGRPVLLCASTREGEEEALLDGFLAVRASLPAGTLLVLVPRHPQRFEAVARMITARGLTLARRSTWDGTTPLAPADVLLGDSMGEMPAWYAAADLAYVGGSLVPLGGQNLIEACLAGCPVLLGPHTFNFAQASVDALAAGAARRVQDVAELFWVAGALLADPPSLAAMAGAGQAFARRHSGATARSLAALGRFLPPVTGPAGR